VNYTDPPKVEQLKDPKYRAALLEAVTFDDWEPRDFDLWVKRFCQALEEVSK